MWLTSKTPAAVRTASCSSLTLRYCWGISQPANSTMRAPAATWWEWSGVRLTAIRSVLFLDERVQVDVVQFQVLQDLFVVTAAGIGHHLADLLGPLSGPLQLRRELQVRRRAAQFPAAGDLGLHVVVCGLQQHTAVVDGLLLVPERPVHVIGDLLADERLEVAAPAGREALDPLQQADGAFLEQVALAEPSVGALPRRTEHPVQMRVRERL